MTIDFRTQDSHEHGLAAPVEFKSADVETVEKARLELAKRAYRLRLDDAAIFAEANRRMGTKP